MATSPRAGFGKTRRSSRNTRVLRVREVDDLETSDKVGIISDSPGDGDGPGRLGEIHGAHGLRALWIRDVDHVETGVIVRDVR
jgi:hypothetical protein